MAHPRTLLASTAGSTAAATACPTGITGSAAQATLALACTNLNAGYAVLSAITAQTVAGALTTLTAGITTCANNNYCPGAASAFAIVGTTTFTYAAVTVPAAGSGAQTACPTGTGNAHTGATASGINAVSAATACVDLLSGYALAAVTSQTALPGTLVVSCAAGTYSCTGLAGLFVATAPISGKGITIASGTSMAMSSAYPPVLPSAVTVSSTSLLLAQSCPTGSTNTAAGATIASCLVTPGYYIDPSAVNTPVACAVGEYCPGNGGLYLNAAGTATAVASVLVGTAGGEYNCPSGSVTPGTASSTANNALSDCNLLPNYYIPAAATGAALFVPVSCPAGSQCPGGSAIGAAGGSSLCPPGSTIPACTATVAAPGPVTNLGPSSTSVNATPVIVNLPLVSAAPLAAAANSAVLALAALVALVAF